MQFTKLELATMAGGAAEEQFQRALGEVIANISDVNTKASKVRKIVVEIEFLPAESRDNCAVGIRTKTNLTANRGVVTTAFIGVDQETGLIVANEHNPKQMVVGEDIEDRIDEQPENVTPFTKEDAGA